MLKVPCVGGEQARVGEEGMTRPRVLWLSANLFGLELLKETMRVKEAKVVGVLTLSAESKTKMYDGVGVCQFEEVAQPVYEIEDINREARLIKSLRPDVAVMCGWRQIIDKKILGIPRWGFIGFHPTLLPKGRGPAPIINTILGGYDRSGITLFQVSEKVDCGDIIGQESFDILPHDYAMDIYNKVIEHGKFLIRGVMPNLRIVMTSGMTVKIPQDETDAAYFEKRTHRDNEIRLGRDTPEMVYRKIRAFSKPYDGAFVRLKDGKKLVIWKADLEEMK